MKAGPGTSIFSLSVASLAVYLIRRRFLKSARSYSSIAIRTTPPKLPKRPHYVGFGDIEGATRGENPMEIPLYLYDPYFYVRDDKRKDQFILNHLEEENKYTNFKTQHLEEAREMIYNELLSHIQETDSAYPYPHGPYLYYTRTEKGKSYRIRCRKPRDTEVEEVIFDENEMAKGFNHFEMSSASPSPDHTLVAYAVDTNGYETYSASIKNLSTQQLLDDKIENTSGSLVWGKDNKTIFYATMDEAHRVHKIWKHVIGTKASEDVCLYTEPDELYSAFFFKTKSGRFLMIGSGSSETTEYHVLDLHDDKAELKLFHPREFGVQYSVNHHEDQFYIVTNRDKATNFKLMKTSLQQTNAKHWTAFVPYDASIKTDYIECFKDFIVIFGRQGGLSRVWIHPMNGTGSMYRLEFEEPIYTVDNSVNKEYETDRVRISYSSLTTPSTTYDYDMKSKEKIFLKQQPCPNYDASLYKAERLEATSNDGVTIPMSVVYRKDKVPASGPRPVHLYGYGSYEICIDPDFRSTVLPMLDHGVTYIIAHIRGGGEMGRSWYEDAKYKTKKKTFEDFVACAEHLVNTKYTTPSQMTCEGRSAGGLLMGAVLNMRPDLFQAAVAGVPFVDVMNSMCDSTIPLTTGEWEEWGNPNTAEYFSYMLSYSPYENVKAQKYPNILITSGLYDPRVAYWEPTKWAARLRELKTDDNDVLLKMDLSSGHFSASDRYHYLREKAFDISYLLDQLRLL